MRDRSTVRTDTPHVVIVQPDAVRGHEAWAEQTKLLDMRGQRASIAARADDCGPTETALFLEGKSEETVERLTKAAPLERLGQPDDIASAVSFLAGPDGAWVNAQVIRVNGGAV